MKLLAQMRKHSWKYAFCLISYFLNSRFLKKKTPTLLWQLSMLPHRENTRICLNLAVCNFIMSSVSQSWRRHDPSQPKLQSTPDAIVTSSLSFTAKVTEYTWRNRDVVIILHSQSYRVHRTQSWRRHYPSQPKLQSTPDAIVTSSLSFTTKVTEYTWRNRDIVIIVHNQSYRVDLTQSWRRHYPSQPKLHMTAIPTYLNHRSQVIAFAYYTILLYFWNETVA